MDMVRQIETLPDIAKDFDAIVLDQWGVLHDGKTPYPGSIDALKAVKAQGVPLGVLSNSGKSATANMARITGTGFPEGLFDAVMTSGEALWRDMQSGAITHRRFFVAERKEGDGEAWAAGLEISFTGDIAKSDSILLLGLPDDKPLGEWEDVIAEGLAGEKELICANPDIHSVRPGGVLIPQAGAVAREYEKRGGKVAYFGKPYPKVFRMMEAALGVGVNSRILMVGDSLIHDIKGADGAGWHSLFVTGGIHHADFPDGASAEKIKSLAAAASVAPPTYFMEGLR